MSAFERASSAPGGGVRSPGRLIAAGLAATIITAVWILLLASSAYAATKDDGNITVEVTDGVEVTPSPSATPGPSLPAIVPTVPIAPPPSTSAPATPAQVTQATIPDPQSADEALGDDGTSLGGILWMSGLTAEAAPSFDVGNGALTLSFVVRNTSEGPIDASARFWTDNLVGIHLAEVPDVKVERLEPDETRRVMVRIEGLGQHPVLRNYVTLTPPPLVDGVELASMTRNVTIGVPPLFLLSLVSGVGAFSGLVWWAVSARGLRTSIGRLGR